MRFVLALFATNAAYSQIPTPEMNAVFTEAAGALASLNFDAKAPVSIRGRIAMLVFPARNAGMVVVDVGGERYAFSIARVPAMAKQGFGRMTMKPGQEVIVTGVLAQGGAKVGPGATAARADTISMLDGKRVFDRANLNSR